MACGNRLSDLCRPGRPNSIGVLRYLLAAMVVFSHCFALGGYGVEPLLVWSHRQIKLGTLSVNCFFILSGFLVAHSFVTTRSLPRYLWHRVLRIFPAFWICLVVIAFGFGGLLYYQYHHGLAGFLSVRVDSPVHYVTRNWFLEIKQIGVAGLLRGIPLRVNFNGSLWSLVCQFKCYLALGILGGCGLFTRFRRVGQVVVLVMLAAFIVKNAYPPKLLPSLDFIWTVIDVNMSVWFCAGVACYLFADHIPVHWALFVVSAALSLLGLHYDFYRLAAPFALSYTLFWLALRLPLSWWGRDVDVSYGLYLYAFPVQQTLVAFGLHKRGVVYYFGLAMVIATTMAVVSYFAIERPALSLKHLRLPARPPKPAG